ncbi:Uncharacterised protein [Salmonella enterica subsp. enterica serovar Typhi]|nr:Uncharacterised protein [Salmonella enterica subsp. enterica serovar Typhi]
MQYDQRTLLDGFTVQLEVDGADHLVFLQRRVQFCGIQYIARFQIFHATARDRQVNVFIDAQRGAIGITKPGGFRGELFTSLQRINGFKETEAPRQQFFAFCFTAFIGPSAHYGGNQSHLAFGCGSDQIIARFAGMAGFDAVHIQAVIPQQTVTV